MIASQGFSSNRQRWRKLTQRCQVRELAAEQTLPDRCMTDNEMGLGESNDPFPSWLSLYSGLGIKHASSVPNGRPISRSGAQPLDGRVYR
jgi:hypothetical protein